MAEQSIYEDLGDACSILTPVDVINTPGVLSYIRYGPSGLELPEDPNPAWSASTTYGIGQRVHLVSTHRVYESAAASNLGKDPSSVMNQYNAAGNPTWWIDIGPTNKYAAFDGAITSQTSGSSPLVITLTPGAFTGLALFGLEADSYSIEVRDAPGGSLIYNEQNVSLESTAPADYYEYFFDRFKPMTQLIRTSMEPYSNSEIILKLYKGSGEAKIGMFAIGDLRPIGVAQRDVQVEPQDFSYFRQDAFGNSVIKRRPSATGMRLRAVLDLDDANAVLDTVKGVLGTPVVVVASQAAGFEWLTVFGLISGSISPVPYPYATLDLTVKGFI